MKKYLENAHFGKKLVLAGAIQAVEESDLNVSLIGDESILNRVLQSQSSASSRLQVVHASQVVSMGESPFEAVRKKKDSSIARAFDLVRSGDVDGVVSAGNSGATMASAIKYLGRLETTRAKVSALAKLVGGEIIHILDKQARRMEVPGGGGS